MVETFVTHYVINSLTPCFEKTPCVYHLHVRLARDLFYKVQRSEDRCQRTENTIRMGRFLIQYLLSVFCHLISVLCLLKLTEAIVESLSVHQFGMAAGFDDAAPVEDDDPIDVANRR